MSDVSNLAVAYEAVRTDSITTASILAGVGLLGQKELCSLIALMESIDSFNIAKGAIQDIGQRLLVLGAEKGRDIETLAENLEVSWLTTSVLRHRLLTHLAASLAVPPVTPLSTKSATQMAAALAIRSSERLTPSVIAERKRRLEHPSQEGYREILSAKLADLYKAASSILDRQKPLPFPELVREEVLNMLSDADLVQAAAREADPAIREALAAGHAAAQAALAAGGSWAVFAAIVGSAGFAPYLLAAQLSAWIPMVSGPALVSLLATLINPTTVLVGIGAIAWYGMSTGSSLVRSQIAARLCVVLATSGTRAVENGLARFVSEMRLLDGAPAGALSHLSEQDRRALRERLAFMNQRLTRPLPEAAGTPPEPWNARRDLRKSRMNNLEAGGIALMTAGEMLWRAAALDERVLEAADFSRSADMGDPFSFAVHAQDFAVRGSDFALRGYVAERLVLDRLVGEGHDVILADASNTPGFDLIVDGDPVQVKCGAELSNLIDHFAKYPDVPVIANEELACKAAEWAATQPGETWVDLVVALPGIDLHAIETLIADTLGHAAALTDPGVLELALSVGILRGGLEVVRGEIPIEDLPVWLIIDGAARGGLGLIGGKAGAWVGLVAVGPAGALILGPAAACAALFGVGAARGVVSSLLMREWHRELLSEGAKLQEIVLSALEKRIAVLARRVDRMRTEAAGRGELGFWMIRRAEDDLISVLEARCDLGSMPANERDVTELVISAKRAAPTDRKVLRAAAAVERCLQGRPHLNEVVLRRPFEALCGWAKGSS